MLEKRFSDIRKVALKTGEIFCVSCKVPEELPADWLEEFKNGQLALKLDNNHLIVRPYFGSEIRIELDTKIDFSKQEEWRSEMQALKLNDFSFSTFGVLLSSNNIFNIADSHIESESALQNELKPEIISEPESVEQPEIKKCPHCGQKLFEEEIEKGHCEECDEDFWSCPRCGDLITENSDDLDNCPACKRNYARVECPSCCDDMWADESKCSSCGDEFETSKCPYCKKFFIVSDRMGECPFCDEYIYMCPRCREYINTDPNDTNFCSLCKKTLIVIDCPNCHDEIFPDVRKCENCGVKFKLAECPYSDCAEPLIISEAITTCPYCENDIQHISCPHCKEEFYIEAT